MNETTIDFGYTKLIDKLVHENSQADNFTELLFLRKFYN